MAAALWIYMESTAVEIARGRGGPWRGKAPNVPLDFYKRMRDTCSATFGPPTNCVRERIQEDRGKAIVHLNDGFQCPGIFSGG